MGMRVVEECPHLETKNPLRSSNSIMSRFIQLHHYTLFVSNRNTHTHTHPLSTNRRSSHHSTNQIKKPTKQGTRNWNDVQQQRQQQQKRSLNSKHKTMHHHHVYSQNNPP